MLWWTVCTEDKIEKRPLSSLIEVQILAKYLMIVNELI